MTRSGKNIGEEKDVLVGNRLQCNMNGTEGGGHKYFL